MGGQITVESQQEQGTTFKFEIPLSVVDPIAILAPKIDREVTGLQPNQPRYRILIVDDREDNCQLLVKMLSPIGFAVEAASNGHEAVEIWENWQPHLILMDLRMPVMDGYEATREIRARVQQREREQAGGKEMNVSLIERPIPKIIALTASTIAEKPAFVLFVGCDDLICKPFRKTDILDTLNRHLGVNYTYSCSSCDRPQLSDSTSTFTLTSVSKLPAEWTEKIKQVIRSADFDLIARTIEEIWSENPAFSELLQGHLDNFDYQKILILISEAEKSNNSDDGRTK
jgi:CheY-like chemotaxis protein